MITSSVIDTHCRCQQSRYHRDPRGYGGREKRAGQNPRIEGLMVDDVALLLLRARVDC